MIFSGFILIIVGVLLVAFKKTVVEYTSGTELPTLILGVALIIAGVLVSLLGLGLFTI